MRNKGKHTIYIHTEGNEENGNRRGTQVRQIVHNEMERRAKLKARECQSKTGNT